MNQNPSPKIVAAHATMRRIRNGDLDTSRVRVPAEMVESRQRIARANADLDAHDVGRVDMSASRRRAAREKGYRGPLTRNEVARNTVQ